MMQVQSQEAKVQKETAIGCSNARVYVYVVRCPKMLREFFCSGPPRRLGVAWGGLLVFLLHALFRARLKWALNSWYKTFYDVLQDAEVGSGESGSGDHLAAKRQEVFDLLVEFGFIVLPAVFVHPIGKWCGSVWRFKWRMALVRAYLLHYDVRVEPIEGAAQRIHEDTQRFDEGIYQCLSVVLDSILTLVVFIPILLEAGATAHPPGVESPAWLLVVAVTAAGGGLVVSAVVGRKLVTLEVENQKVEAQLRTKLVLLETTPEVVVGEDGDSPSRTISDADFVARRRPRNVSPLNAIANTLADLWANYRRLFFNFAAFNLWIASFDQFMVVLPYTLVAPLLFASDPTNRITLGTLMQVTNSFDKVFASMAVVTESWPQVNEFRSCVRRLREFERRIYTRRHFDRQLLTDDDPLPAEVAVPVVEISLDSAEPTWVSRPV